MRLDLKYKTLFEKYEVNTPLRKAHFLAQLEHESGLRPIAENLNYSIKALIRVFKRRFDRNKDGYLDDNEKVKLKEIAGNPKKVANFIYANIIGNGDEASGDGWKFRGRGFIQLTGRNNYRALSRATGIDYESSPDKLLNEADAMIAALWFWNVRHLNVYADLDDVRKVTKIINGGYNGIGHRTDLLEKWRTIFDC